MFIVVIFAIMFPPISIHVEKQQLDLYPSKVAFWQEQSMLIMADAHFGKIAHFRKSGIAAPAAVATFGISRLETLLNELKPATCLFLGDLFHSHINREWQNLASMVKQFSRISFHLVEGNHDLIEKKLLSELGINSSPELVCGPFLFTHYPGQREDHFNICGHIHPGVKLHGPALQYEKLPCFHLSPGQLILPSFGLFTGMKIIRPKKGERIFVVTPTEVIEANLPEQTL